MSNNLTIYHMLSLNFASGFPT